MIVRITVRHVPDHILTIVVVINILDVWRPIAMRVLRVVASHRRCTRSSRLVILVNALLPGNTCKQCMSI